MWQSPLTQEELHLVKLASERPKLSPDKIRAFYSVLMGLYDSDHYWKKRGLSKRIFAVLGNKHRAEALLGIEPSEEISAIAQEMSQNAKPGVIIKSETLLRMFSARSRREDLEGIEAGGSLLWSEMTKEIQELRKCLRSQIPGTFKSLKSCLFTQGSAGPYEAVRLSRKKLDEFVNAFSKLEQKVMNAHDHGHEGRPFQRIADGDVQAAHAFYHIHLMGRKRGEPEVYSPFLIEIQERTREDLNIAKKKTSKAASKAKKWFQEIEESPYPLATRMQKSPNEILVYRQEI